MQEGKEKIRVNRIKWCCFLLFRQQRCVIKYPTEWRYNTIFGLYGHENNQPFLPPALHGNRDNRNLLEMLSTALGARYM